MASSVRIHDGSYQVDRWRGTLEELGDLLRVADEEVSKRHDSAARRYDSLSVVYDDGREDFPSVAHFTAAIPRIDRAKVKSVICRLSPSGTTDSVSIHVSGYPAIDIDVHSEDRLWAHGLAEVLGEVVAPGERPQYNEKRRPLKWWETVLVAIGVCSLLALFVLVLINVIDFAGALLLFAVLLGPIGVPLIDATERRVRNPQVELVDEAAMAPESGPPKLGVTVRAQDWIRKRPLLSVMLSFVFAIAANMVSDRI